MSRKTLIAPVVFGLVFLVSSAMGQDKKGESEDVAKGKEVFEQCGVCHNADSEEKKMGPGLKGLFKKQTFADGKTKVTEESVTKKINEGGNGMPAYAEMLERADVKRLIAYLKTL
jgi:mono/diheme cytochrome c family protein